MYRKIYFDIERKRALRRQLSDSDDISRVNRAINNSKYHVIAYNVLVIALEDIPQISIVLIVGIISDIHNFAFIAYVNLSMSVSMILFKIAYCVCGKMFLGEDEETMQSIISAQALIMTPRVPIHMRSQTTTITKFEQQISDATLSPTIRLYHTNGKKVDQLNLDDDDLSYHLMEGEDDK